jgi:hypothetical protein
MGAGTEPCGSRAGLIQSPNSNAPVRVAVFGRTGTGKSVFLRTRFYPWKDSVWLDTLGEHRPPGAQTFTETMPALEAIEARRFPVVLQPVEDGAAEFVGRMALAVGRCAVVVEEAAYFCRGWYPPPWLDRLSRLGRGYGVSLVFTSQRPSEVPRILTSQSTDVIVAGAVTDPSDVEYLSRTTSPEFARATMAGRDLEYLCWNGQARAWTVQGTGVAYLPPRGPESAIHGSDEPMPTGDEESPPSRDSKIPLDNRPDVV